MILIACGKFNLSFFTIFLNILCEVILNNKQLLNEVEHDIENYQGRGLWWITQTEALIILDIMRKPNSIIVLLCIQNVKSSTRGTDEHLV